MKYGLPIIVTVLSVLLATQTEDTRASTLDQSFIGPPSGGIGIDSQDIAQTFEVGITGKLAQIDLFHQFSIPRTGTLTIAVRPTASGIPIEDASSNLGQVTFDLADLTTPGLIQHDFSTQNIPVVQGDVLAIVITGDASNTPAAFEFSTANGYSNGQHFFRSSFTGGVWGDAFYNDSADLLFQSHVVPEPSMGFLAASGIMLLSVRRFRKK